MKAPLPASNEASLRAACAAEGLPPAVVAKLLRAAVLIQGRHQLGPVALDAAEEAKHCREVYAATVRLALGGCELAAGAFDRLFRAVLAAAEVPAARAA